jgi:hypothetical protein
VVDTEKQVAFAVAQAVEAAVTTLRPVGSALLAKEAMELPEKVVKTAVAVAAQALLRL